MQKKYIKPFVGPLSDFPKDTDVPEGVSVVRFADRKNPDPELHINVVYDRKNDVDLHLQILIPFHMDEPEKKFPLMEYYTGVNAPPRSLSVYSVFGGTTGYIVRMISPSCSDKVR